MNNFIFKILLLIILASCVGTNTDVYHGYSKSGVISSFEVAALKSRHLEMVNALRLENGRSPLKHSISLSAASKTHAFDIARQQRAWNYGSDASSAIDRAKIAGFKGLVLGENVSETYEGEYEVLEVWFQSKIGKEIILDSNATHLGLSWYQDSTGKVWWVQMIGQSL
ncbi:MAG: hypothetical protein CML35_02880 [Rhodobacteraceae bacterium]|nr:hypothetical protein [Paracoccaceae bacterium]|tara:strand:+ start:757 stop:1260 length:504 start_codon:yes stop_codon:yes gene_type:complete